MDYNLYGCECLANEIIRKAAVDYREALVNEHKAELNDDLVKLRESSLKVKMYERWFKSGVYNNLSTFSGRILIEKIRNEVIAYNYDLKKLYDSHLSKEAINYRIKQQAEELVLQRKQQYADKKRLREEQVAISGRK